MSTTTPTPTPTASAMGCARPCPRKWIRWAADVEPSHPDYRSGPFSDAELMRLVRAGDCVSTVWAPTEYRYDVDGHTWTEGDTPDSVWTAWTTPDDEDGRFLAEWRREIARESGMLLGVDAHNDALF